MTEGKLVFLPKGYRVVPEEATDEMLEAADLSNKFEERYELAVKAAPQLTTPPVLRWDDNTLYLGHDYVVTWIANDGDGTGWYFQPESGQGIGSFSSREEARRAAEKALGFPDGLIIEEV